MKSKESAKNPPRTRACCPIQPFLSMIHKIGRAAPKSLTASFSLSLYLSGFFYFPRAEASMIFGVSKTHPHPQRKGCQSICLHNLSFQSACNKKHYSSSPNVFLVSTFPPSIYVLLLYFLATKLMSVINLTVLSLYFIDSYNNVNILNTIADHF